MSSRLTILTYDDLSNLGQLSTMDTLNYYDFKISMDVVKKSELMVYINVNKGVPGGEIKVLKDRGNEFYKSKNQYDIIKKQKISNGVLVRTPMQSQIDYLYKILMDSKYIPISDELLKIVILTLLRGWYPKEHIDALNSIRGQFSHILTLGTLT